LVKKYLEKIERERKAPVGISLSPSLIDEIDARRKPLDWSRSQYIRQAIAKTLALEA
jgi:metal-responsive CopG/Arc/MetJ family transcriptional regulator